MSRVQKSHQTMEASICNMQWRHLVSELRFFKRSVLLATLFHSCCTWDVHMSWIIFHCLQCLC